MAWFSRCIPLVAIHKGHAFPPAPPGGRWILTCYSQPMLSHLLLAIVTINLKSDFLRNNYLSIMTRLLDVLG